MSKDKANSFLNSRVADMLSELDGDNNYFNAKQTDLIYRRMFACVEDLREDLWKDEICPTDKAGHVLVLTTQQKERLTWLIYVIGMMEGLDSETKLWIKNMSNKLQSKE